MAKRKTRKIDPDGILLTIYRLTFGRRGEIDQELSDLPRGNFDRQQQLLRERSKFPWASYSLDTLAGQSLDPAGKKSLSRAVLTLEQSRMVAIRGYGRGSEIKLTPAGKKHAVELLATVQKKKKNSPSPESEK